MKNKRTRLRQGYGGQAKSAQDIQDDIFRKMSADKKLEVAAGLWLLAKELNPKNIRYDGGNRPAAASYKRR